VLFLQDYDVDVSDTTIVTTFTFCGAQARDTTIVTHCLNVFFSFPVKFRESELPYYGDDMCVVGQMRDVWPKMKADKKVAMHQPVLALRGTEYGRFLYSATTVRNTVYCAPLTADFLLICS
jgi:hypothetical protein